MIDGENNNKDIWDQHIERILKNNLTPDEAQNVENTKEKETEELEILMHKKKWLIPDLERVRELMKKSDEKEDILPLTKDWMKSTEWGQEVWRRTVRVIRIIGLLIGEVSGVKEDSNKQRSQLILEMERLVDELSAFGVTPEAHDHTWGYLKSLSDFALNPEMYLKHWATKFFKEFPDISTHHNKGDAQLKPFDEDSPLSQDFDGETLGFIDTNNMPVWLENLYHSSSKLHMIVPLLDCKYEFHEGL